MVAHAVNHWTVSIPVAALGVTARWKMRTWNSMWIVLHLILQNLIYCHLLKLSHINLVLKFLVLSFSHSLYECRTPETKFISEWFELLKNYLPTNTLTTTNKAKNFMFRSKSAKLCVKMWNCYRNIDVPKGIHHIGQNGVNFAMWPNVVYDCDRVLTYELWNMSPALWLWTVNIWRTEKGRRPSICLHLSIKCEYVMSINRGVSL